MPQPVVKYSDEELIDLVKAEGTLSDWRKAAAITATEVEESVASDPDEDDMTMSWNDATSELSQHRQKPPVAD